MLAAACLFPSVLYLPTLGQIQHTWQIWTLAAFEVCSQVYNMEIKVHFYL